MMKNKWNWEIKLVSNSIMEMNKSVLISLRKGRYKAWGESRNRSSELEYYHLRDEYRALLYSALRLLIKLYEFGTWTQIRRLQYILLKSPFLRILCIDNVLSNKGGFTPGLDGKKGLSDKEVQWFVKSKFSELKKLCYDVKLVWIPKENTNELRPLGISNALSKCAQELVRVLLEPVLEWEVSKGETESFGSRTGKSALMAVNTLVQNLNSVLPTFIINLDISKCFDMISHVAIWKESFGRMHPEMIDLLEAMLKYDIVDGKNGIRRGNNGVGTPQGSVVSPLICNMILSCIKTHGSRGNNIKVIRYVDVFIIGGYGSGTRWLAIIEEILKDVGLGINRAKTEIYFPYTKKDFSFNFLGYEIHYNHKIRKFHLGIPSKKVDKIVKKLKNLFKDEKAELTSAWAVVKKLEPIIRGWSNYYDLIDKYKWARICWNIDGHLWNLLYQWTREQRTRRGITRYIDKYWVVQGKVWQFFYWRPVLDKDKKFKEWEKVFLKWFKESKPGGVVNAAEKGHRWDENFQSWYHKGLQGWIWHSLQPKIIEGVVNYRHCTFCGEAIKDDVGIYVMRNKLYTEVSGKFIAEAKNASKDIKIKTKDVGVKKIKKHFVLCVHWNCLNNKSKETQEGVVPH